MVKTSTSHFLRYTLNVALQHKFGRAPTSPILILDDGTLCNPRSKPPNVYIPVRDVPSLQLRAGGCFDIDHTQDLAASGLEVGQTQGPSMVPAPRGVRDVPAEEFIKAYADHLKTNDKVRRGGMMDFANATDYKLQY